MPNIMHAKKNNRNVPKRYNGINVNEQDHIDYAMVEVLERTTEVHAEDYDEID